MWNLIRDLGDGEKLVKCSECGFQLATDNLPSECPNCGEVMGGMARKAINLKESSLEVKETEPEVYEYERDVPVYKLWYFWLAIIIIAIIISIGGRAALTRLNAEPAPRGNETSEDISFDVPTGWSESGEHAYVGPGETSDITVITCPVSRLDKIEDLSRLVGDLTGIEEISAKEVNGIDGRYMTWTTRKISEGKEVFTDYARYSFIHKGKLYILTFKTMDGNLSAFDTFLMSIKR